MGEGARVVWKEEDQLQVAKYEAGILTQTSIPSSVNRHRYQALEMSKGMVVMWAGTDGFIYFTILDSSLQFITPIQV